MLRCLWPQTYCSSSGTLGSEAMRPVLDIYQVLPMRCDSFIQQFCLFICPTDDLIFRQIKELIKNLVPCNLECNTILVCFSSCECYTGTPLNFMILFMSDTSPCSCIDQPTFLIKLCLFLSEKQKKSSCLSKLDFFN